MKKYLIAIIFMVIFANSVNAFSYRCIESGMTKSEYHEACNTAVILGNKGSYTKEEVETDLHYGYDYSGSPFAEKSNRGTLSWTEDGLLWRVQLKYSVPDDILKGLALRKTLNDKFVEEIQESSSSSSYGTSNYYTIVLVDSAISDPAIEKLIEKIDPSI